MLDQENLINIYRTSHPTATECTFFSGTQGTFSRKDYILGHKTRLNKFKKIEIISSIFSDRDGIKQEISYKNKTEKFTNMWRLNNMLLNNQCIKDENKSEIKNLDV